ncbi:MAG: hypothetical protein EXS16_00375 [Gemmataceae bacterium]|nr:hypothetical protein [Gemmataceae bacterium]
MREPIEPEFLICIEFLCVLGASVVNYFDKGHAMTRCISISIAVLLLAFSSLDAGEYWPMWRGPTGIGVSDEKGLPTTWGGKTQENVLWKAALFPSEKGRRDQNQSSPIVWGERVFVTVSYWPEDVSEKNFPEHHLLCFATKDGAKLWDTPIEPGPWKLTDLRGGYTAPTPATDGKRVYVAFGSAVLAAVDFQGKLAWRKEIKPYDFDVAWASSPIINEGAVIVVCDQMRGKKSSVIHAFEGATGASHWEKKRPDIDWAHSTPIIAKIAEKLQLVVATSNGPQGINLASGEVIWSAQVGQRVGDTVSPVVSGDVVYVDSGRGGIGVTVKAKGTGDLSKTGLGWKIPALAEGFSSPLVVGGRMYRLNSPGVLGCWNWQSGKELFKERLEGVDPAISPIVTADGLIYCANANKSYVLKASAKAEVVGRGELGDPSRASPAIAGGRIYLKGSRYLYCVGKK